MSEKVKVKVERPEDILTMPAIALRGLVIFPNNIVHFEVGRAKSIAAINWAMEHSSPVFLIAQREVDVEDPAEADLYRYGVISEVKQFLRVDEKSIKVLVEGKQRAKLLRLENAENFLVSDVKRMPVRNVSATNQPRLEALVRSIREEFHTYLTLNPHISKEAAMAIMTSDDARFLSEFIPSNVLFRYQDKQAVLDENSLLHRMETLQAIFHKENQVLSIEQEIQEKAGDEMDRQQREYYLREQMNAIMDELGDSEDMRSEAEKYKKQILELHLAPDTEEKLVKECDRLGKTSNMSPDASVSRTYLDTVLELPWNRSTVDSIDLARSQEILDRDHYGLKKVKDRILELLAVRKMSSELKGQIICLVGPPGVGKTSIAHSVAECMGRNYTRMSLGGVRDEAEIRGHRRTYVGALPGRLITAIIQAKSNNPLILLDEIDKLGADFRGDPASALLEALDPEQNSTFKDHYLDIPFDLSHTLFITTANTLDTIPRPLLDRMDVIELPSYTREEKLQIAKKHLYPKQLKKCGLTRQVRFTPNAFETLIDSYTAEAGVRNLERVIAEVLRKCAKEIELGAAVPLQVNAVKVQELLGPKRRKPAFLSRSNQIGIANGLAWTSIGGEVLPIEVAIIPEGAGKIELTGSLGDVMKESAHLAVTFARVHAKEYGIDAELLKKADIHIHAPEGAVPKDGPSAGVTLTTALISALSGRPVRSDVAMTGEITLHGNVLPIGGLREKSMAAYQENLTTVLIPHDNVPDLYEVDPVVKEKLHFIPVRTLHEVLNTALLNDSVKKERTVPERKKPPIKEAGTFAQC